MYFVHMSHLCSSGPVDLDLMYSDLMCSMRFMCMCHMGLVHCMALYFCPVRCMACSMYRMMGHPLMGRMPMRGHCDGPPAVIRLQ